MLTRETQLPCHWGVYSDHLWVSSHCFCVATGVGQSFHVSLPGLSTFVFLLSQQTVSPDSPKVYKFSMWFGNTYWPSLVQEETRRGNTMDRPQSTWLVPTSVVILLSWLALESREHMCWELSYCLRGFAQKRHSGFSPETTSTSHISVLRALKLKRLVTWHPVQLRSIQFWLVKLELGVQTVSSSQSRRWKGINHPVSAVNTAPGLSAHFPRCSVCLYFLHYVSVTMSWQFLSTLQLNCTVSSAGVDPMFLPLFTNITQMDSNWIYRFKSIG